MDDRTRGIDQRAQRDEALLLVIVSILLFSTLDGIFTLLLLETGQVHEWNPLLAPLIDRDVQVFANLKTVVTGGGLFLLATFVDRSLFRRIPVRSVIETIFVAYALLMVYHLTLMLRVAG